MKTNTSTRTKVYTHEGAPARNVNAEFELRRTLMACLLWEKTFYESGVDVADRISALVPKVAADKVAAMAIEAREKSKLRHAPLWVVREMARASAKHRALVGDTLARVIKRADELAEFLALYWKDGRQPLSAQVKLGLASAFNKFDAYQLAKYDRKDADIKLRDVLFMVHARAKDAEQDAIWKQLIDGTLPIPQTWENRLSAGEDKKTVWESMIREGDLGALAFLRNLRNMKAVGVDLDIVLEGLKNLNVRWVLPYRFIAAARAVPVLEEYLEPLMYSSLESYPRLDGKTKLLIDVSGSMGERLSTKSDMTRLDAACGVAILVREICPRVEVYTFSEHLVEVPPRHGFALRDAIVNSQRHWSTHLGSAVSKLDNNDYDRLIVISDEESHDPVPNPKGRGYMINPATYQYGVGYAPWVHIDGWSENVIDFILAYESLDVPADM